MLLSSERFMEAVLQAEISGYTQVSMYDLRSQLSNRDLCLFSSFLVMRHIADALLRVDEVLMIYMIAEALLHNETDDIEK